MRSDRWLRAVARLPISPLRARGLRACLRLAILGSFLALCGHPHYALAARPSNADTAFTQVPLLAPSGGTGYVTGVGHPTWPTFLDSVLVRAIGGSDSILIASTRTQGVRIGLNGSVTYTFPPHTFANRVGTIVTADDWTNPLESTLPMLIASFTFADGRTWGTGTLYDVTSNLGYPYLLYYRVRDWSDQVVPGDPGFVTKPLNPAVFQLCAQASNGGVGNVYSDLQTFYIPDTLRNTALQTVTFASHTTAFDSTHVTSARGLVTGCAVWPQFDIANRTGASLVTQKQSNATWGGHAYGGYYYNGALIRADSTIAYNGCLLTCISMVHQYFGVTCDPDTLNRFLQWHRGYLAPAGIAVDSVVSASLGSTVGFRWLGTSQPTGTRYVVEGNPYEPVAILSTRNTTGRRGRAAIVQLFGSWPADSVLQGIIRNYVNPIIASGPFTNPGNPLDYRWRVFEGPFMAVPNDSVEQALGDSLPVLLQVDRGVHWVVASGRRPAWESPTQPRGTYSIAGPLYSATALFPSHSNTYLDALRVERGPSRAVPGPYRASADPAPACAVLLSGPAHLYLQAPDGPSIRFDANTENYVSTIPGAIALRSISTPNDGSLVGTSAPCDLIVIPEASDGDYDLVIQADSAGLASMRVETVGSAGTPTGATGSVDLPSASQVRFILHHSGYETSLEQQGGTTSVPPTPTASLSVGVHPNPLVGRGVVSWSVDRGEEGSVVLFDVSGRRLRTLYSGKMEPGSHQVSLEGGAIGALEMRPGLYFVRVAVGARTGIARCVVLGSDR